MLDKLEKELSIIYYQLLANKVIKDGNEYMFSLNMEALDTDNDGTINMQEFIVAAVGKEVLFSENILRAGFNLICHS
jgi:hypothetical protein